MARMIPFKCIYHINRLLSKISANIERFLDVLTRILKKASLLATEYTVSIEYPARSAKFLFIVLHYPIGQTHSAFPMPAQFQCGTVSVRHSFNAAQSQRRMVSMLAQFQCGTVTMRHGSNAAQSQCGTVSMRRGPNTTRAKNGFLQMENPAQHPFV